MHSIDSIPDIRSRRKPHAAMAMLGVVMTLGACSSESTGPHPSNLSSGKVVLTTRVASEPALFLQAADGGDRRRVHLQDVRDDIPGNYPGLEVTDAATINLSAPRWSHQGDRFAIVATLAFDQSELVVFDRNGANAEVASPNTQIIAGVPDWSPDGHMIAYAMSTQPRFTGIDIFVTNLVSHTVRRLTTGSHFGRSVLRWDALGRGVYFSRVTGETPGPGFNDISEILYVDATTLEQRVVRSGIIGEVQAISSSGSHVLVLRNRTLVGSSYERDLIRVALPTGNEVVLLTRELLQYASYSSTEMQTFFVTSIVVGPSAQYKYEYLDSEGARRTLSNIEQEATWDVFFPFPPD
jgi:dipeptidyl aminopeptidase/acylaminoacyl peptidase